jgi:hypothetical protein
MNRITVLSILTLLCAALVLSGCQKKPVQQAAAPQGQGAMGGTAAPGGDPNNPHAQGQMPPANMQLPPAQGEMPPGHPQAAGGQMGEVETPPAPESPESAAGVKWNMPKRWTLAEARSMRVATYKVPAAAGDPEGGECGVFFFGSAQGGDVESNIARWVGQFENPSKPERSARTVNGLAVSLVHVTGNYLAPSGPMMQSSGSKGDHALLGAIVAAPQGSVFFKFTGPRKTVDAAKGDFDALVSSLHKQ